MWFSSFVIALRTSSKAVLNYFTRVNLRQGINFNNVPGRVLEVRDVRLPCRMEEVRICCRKFPPTAARPKFLL